MSGREMKKQQTKQIRKPSLLFLFHQLSGTFGPSLSLVESSVCQKCMKQSKYIEMIEKALKCSELEQLSGLVRWSLYGPVRCPSNESISDEGELHRILNSLTINSNVLCRRVCSVVCSFVALKVLNQHNRDHNPNHIIFRPNTLLL